MVSMDYSGKNYIVTGGAGGIGGAVVDGIVSGGGHAVIVDINEAGARKYQEKYGEDKVTVAAVDLSNPAEIREKFGALVQKFGQIHGLICVAGIVSTSKFEDVTQAEWDRVVAINLTGVFASIQSVFTNMKEHSYGRIVVVSSVAAQVGGGLLGTSVYAASKGGVNSLIKAVAKEAGMDQDRHNRILSQIPLGRPADPQEIANLILFYASDLASFVTGEIGNADGGLRMD